MNAEERVFSNDMLRDQILGELNSKDLLQARQVCKFWRNKANRLIRQRQQQFFFSPTSKTRSIEGYNDLKWKKNWGNVLQISFIYSPTRKVFIRASHRLIDADRIVNHLEASSTEPQERRIESSYFQEIEDFHNRVLPGASPDSNFNCKMTGHNLGEFTDYIESMPMSSDSNSWEHSILPYLSFRFDGDRLWDHPEISRFLTMMGPKIRYLTLPLHHVCREAVEPASPLLALVGNPNLYHGYEPFIIVPNLQVLTLVMRLKWSIGNYERQDWLTSMSLQQRVFGNRNRFRFHPAPSGPLPVEAREGEWGPFRHLKCLRVVGRGDEDSGRFTRGILSKARIVEKVIFEKGLSPSVIPALGDVDFNSILPMPRQGQDQGAFNSLLPRPVRVVIPITGLCLQIFEDSPQTFEYMAQIIELQQALAKGQKVKALHLLLMKAPDNYDKRPYNSPVVPPLLRILKAVTQSLETLSLVGGAGMFLEGLIQMAHFNHGQEENRLESFPSVRKLLISFEGPQGINRTDFQWWGEGVNVDPNVTTMSKVFPRVEELSLEDWICTIPDGSRLWECFSPVAGLLAPSVKKITFSLRYASTAYNVGLFPSLETLCLDHFTLGISPAVWTLSSLQTLVINRINIDDPYHTLRSTPRLETLFTGMPNAVITECVENLERSLRAIPEANREQFLREQRAAFRSRPNTWSTPEPQLGQLRQLKLFCSTSVTSLRRTTVRPPFLSQVLGLVLLDLLPPSCHLTIWAMCPNDDSPQPLPYQMLEGALGPMVSSHPRVSLRTVRNENINFVEHPL